MKTKLDEIELLKHENKALKEKMQSFIQIRNNITILALLSLIISFVICILEIAGR
ncbi:MAG: hypothetical protein K2H90_04905 [Oscillospiraceae bacterium]|nr:hypothetical protein [Oscillospiraceae bacterium]